MRLKALLGSYRRVHTLALARSQVHTNYWTNKKQIQIYLGWINMQTECFLYTTYCSFRTEHCTLNILYSVQTTLLEKETICLTSNASTGSKLVCIGLYSKLISANLVQFSALQYIDAQFCVVQFNTEKGLWVWLYQGWKWWIFMSLIFVVN